MVLNSEKNDACLYMAVFKKGKRKVQGVPQSQTAASGIICEISLFKPLTEKGVGRSLILHKSIK